MHYISILLVVFSTMAFASKVPCAFDKLEIEPTENSVGVTLEGFNPYMMKPGSKFQLTVGQGPTVEAKVKGLFHTAPKWQMLCINTHCTENGHAYNINFSPKKGLERFIGGENDYGKNAALYIWEYRKGYEPEADFLWQEGAGDRLIADVPVPELNLFSIGKNGYRQYGWDSKRIERFHHLEGLLDNGQKNLVYESQKTWPWILGSDPSLGMGASILVPQRIPSRFISYNVGAVTQVADFKISRLERMDGKKFPEVAVFQWEKAIRGQPHSPALVLTAAPAFYRPRDPKFRSLMFSGYGAGRTEDQAFFPKYREAFAAGTLNISSAAWIGFHPLRDGLGDRFFISTTGKSTRHDLVTITNKSERKGIFTFEAEPIESPSGFRYQIVFDSKDRTTKLRIVSLNGLKSSEFVDDGQLQLY